MEIEYTRNAKKNLKKIDPMVAEDIISMIEAYAAGEAIARNNAKKLKNQPEHRLRVGDYRVLFEIKSNERKTMVVNTLGHRKHVYD